MVRQDTQGMALAPLPLAGTTVLELNHETSPLCLRLAVSLAAKLAADLGATVLKIEPKGGDPVRLLPPLLAAASRGGTYEFLNTGKTIVDCSAGGRDAAIARLIEGGPSAVIGEEDDPALAQAEARGVPCVTLAGLPALWRGPKPSLSDFTVLALSGMLDMIGDPQREPLRLGGHQASYAAGLAAFTALGAILLAADAGMAVEPARVSLAECMLWVNWKAVAGAQATGVSPSRKGAHAEFQVLRCRDGWVALVYTVTQFDAVVRLVGDPALASPTFATREARIAHGPELYELLTPWFAARTRSEIHAQAQLCNVPLGPVYDAAELLGDAQYKARGFVVEMPCAGIEGPLRLPRLPVLWNGVGYLPRAAVTRSLEDVMSDLQSRVEPRRLEARGREPMRPLQGVRVIDFGQLTAGANTSAMLADLGADVIKIESSENMDLFRLMGGTDREPGWWNRSAQFRFSNRNKRGVSVNMKTEDGRRLVRLLIDRADIVVENFRRGVLERLGIDFPTISASNPRIVLASISSQGETGPNREHVSFGSTLDAMSGMGALTGYRNEAPSVTGVDVNYPDQVVSLFATGMILGALREVRRSGQGALLDISQREIASFLIGEEFVRAGVDPERTPHGPRGNDEPGVLLQDCFRDIHGQWLALTVGDEDAANRLATIVGGESTAEGLRIRFASWLSERAATEAARLLAEAGIPASLVLDGLSLLADPALLGQTVVEADDGALVKGMPYVFGGRAFSVERAAPDLGEHTAEILTDLLGLPKEEFERLKTLGVIQATPLAR